MPLPRQKDDGSSGAPVLKILQAHVRLSDVEEFTEPYTVTRKSDGAEFTLDPGFKCKVEVIDDGREGDDNGATFFETFKYKQLKSNPRNRLEPIKNGPWLNQENSKLGALTKVAKPGYFEDESIPDLTAEDLEGFEMVCQIKPKKNPTTAQVLGSTIDWETMEPLRKKPVAAAPQAEEADDEDEDFKDIPF